MGFGHILHKKVWKIG